MDGMQCARIIGGEDDLRQKRYGFFRDGEPLHTEWPIYFDNDQEAIQWFKEHYPAEFAQGAEMRVYD